MAGRTYPVTRVMINALSGIFVAMSVIIAIYYAGELVWRERERRTAEIIDATAAPDWAFIAPKTLAISLVLISTFAVSVLVAVAIQAIKGYFQPDFGEYLLWWLIPQSIDVVLIAVLAIFVSALSPHKYVGWGLMVLWLVSTLVMANLGLEHSLYQYGSGPNTPLSDMNGQGQFWKGAYWLRLYWSAFAVILLVVAYGLWRRGAETRFLPRLRRLPQRLKGAPGVILALAVVVFAASGSYIYLNTNIWNPYRNHLDDERYMADYEKALWRFHDTPQPTIAAVKLDVVLYPHAPKVVTRGTYAIENRTGAPLSEVHVRFFDRDLKVTSLSVQGAHQKTDFNRFSYRIFAFDTPMLPGDKRLITFETVREQRGFKNGAPLTSVVDNGTFINNFDVSPGLGIDRNNLLQDRSKRRKYGLAPELRMPKLGDPPRRGSTSFATIQSG